MSCTAERFAWLAPLLLVTACATGPTQYAVRNLDAAEQHDVSAQPQALRAGFQKLYAEGRRNEVLNLMEIGVRAYHLGHDDVARTVLDRAIGEIETVYADNEAARRARSLWYEEAEKDFKGEPYERCMVYFYRGMLYLKDGDYGNARASFLSGLMQDAFAEEEQHAADFASLVFLAGWSARLMGSERLAREHFEEYRLLRPDAPLPAADDNVLLLVETGHAPRKLADGVGHYELVFRRGRDFTEQRVVIEGAAPAPLTLYPVEDIYFQASTRGGRPVDRIIKGQVQFRQRSEAVGSTLTAASQSSVLTGLAMSAGGPLSVGFGLMTMVGVAADGMAARTNTRADIRYWSGLPDSLHVRSLRVDASAAPLLRIGFLDAQGQALPALARTAAIQFDSRGNGVLHAGARAPMTR